MSSGFGSSERWQQWEAAAVRGGAVRGAVVRGGSSGGSSSEVAANRTKKQSTIGKSQGNCCHWYVTPMWATATARWSFRQPWQWQRMITHQMFCLTTLVTEGFLDHFCTHYHGWKYHDWIFQSNFQEELFNAGVMEIQSQSCRSSELNGIQHQLYCIYRCRQSKYKNWNA